MVYFSCVTKTAQHGRIQLASQSEPPWLWCVWRTVAFVSAIRLTTCDVRRRKGAKAAKQDFSGRFGKDLRKFPILLTTFSRAYQCRVCLRTRREDVLVSDGRCFMYGANVWGNFYYASIRVLGWVTSRIKVMQIYRKFIHKCSRVFTK